MSYHDDLKRQFPQIDIEYSRSGKYSYSIYLPKGDHCSEKYRKKLGEFLGRHVLCALEEMEGSDGEKQTLFKIINRYCALYGKLIRLQNITQEKERGFKKYMEHVKRTFEIEDHVGNPVIGYYRGNAGRGMKVVSYANIAFEWRPDAKGVLDYGFEGRGDLERVFSRYGEILGWASKEGIIHQDLKSGDYKMAGEMDGYKHFLVDKENALIIDWEYRDEGGKFDECEKFYFDFCIGPLTGKMDIEKRLIAFIAFESAFYREAEKEIPKKIVLFEKRQLDELYQKYKSIPWRSFFRKRKLWALFLESSEHVRRVHMTENKDHPIVFPPEWKKGAYARSVLNSMEKYED